MSLEAGTPTKEEVLYKEAVSGLKNVLGLGNEILDRELRELGDGHTLEITYRPGEDIHLDIGVYNKRNLVLSFALSDYGLGYIGAEPAQFFVGDRKAGLENLSIGYRGELTKLYFEKKDTYYFRSMGIELADWVRKSVEANKLLPLKAGIKFQVPEEENHN